MKLSNNLFVGDGIKKPDRLIEKLNKGKIRKSFFIVVYDSNTQKVEILNSFLFLQKYYQNKALEIFGLFKTNDDALEYIRVLTHLSYLRFDSFDLYKAANTIFENEIRKLYYKEDEE